MTIMALRPIQHILFRLTIVIYLSLVSQRNHIGGDGLYDQVENYGTVVFRIIQSSSCRHRGFRSVSFGVPTDSREHPHVSDLLTKADDACRDPRQKITPR